MKVSVFIFLWAVFNVDAQADDTLSLNSAIERFEQIVTDEKFLSDQWSSSYFIMYKRVYGSSAYLKDFQLLTGIANENKAALMYKVFNINDDSWSTYLLKMKVENAIWQVQSIATYNLVSFEKNKHKFLQ